jgi:flagellar FliL protein
MAAKSSGDADGEEKKKGSPIIKLAILGILVVALGAGGYVGWIKFFKKPSPEASSAHSVEIEKKIIHDWDPFLVNLADAGGKRYLKVTMKLELNGAKAQEELAERNFEMRDKTITILSSKEYEDIATPSGKMRLKQEVMTRLNQILKGGQVKEVYFTDFIVQ